MGWTCKPNATDAEPSEAVAFHPRAMARQQTRGGGGANGSPRAAHDPGSRRHATRSGSGANEPRQHERKDARGFVSRQGGDQTQRTDKPEQEDES